MRRRGISVDFVDVQQKKVVVRWFGWGDWRWLGEGSWGMPLMIVGGCLIVSCYSC